MIFFLQSGKNRLHFILQFSKDVKLDICYFLLFIKSVVRSVILNTINIRVPELKVLYILFRNFVIVILSLFFLNTQSITINSE